MCIRDRSQECSQLDAYYGTKDQAEYLKAVRKLWGTTRCTENENPFIDIMADEAMVPKWQYILFFPFPRALCMRTALTGSDPNDVQGFNEFIVNVKLCFFNQVLSLIHI
eukprot:TRINITY_DN28697_c0_g1_i1.p2 TRINITY_DN28697_c0_g1~~TRINITY_DN28697_c0_g1_i1.p2  ORF type:complete len:128 (+),score=32.13 TRINITY_DN28697_c0_g1_i1:60-386(+)